MACYDNRLGIRIGTVKKILCQCCTGLVDCSTLCDTARNYVTRDHVSQRALPFSCIDTIPLNSIVVNSTVPGPPYRERFTDYDKGCFTFPTLSRSQNRCLFLFWSGGLTAKEIAQRTNTKVRTIESAMARGRERIAVFYSIGEGPRGQKILTTQFNHERGKVQWVHSPTTLGLSSTTTSRVTSSELVEPVVCRSS